MRFFLTISFLTRGGEGLRGASTRVLPTYSLLFGTAAGKGTSGESRTGSFLSSNGDVSGLRGAGRSVAACAALPLIEKLILAFGASFSGATFEALFISFGSREGSGLDGLRIFASSSSSALKSAGGLKGLSSSSGDPADGC
jgi:hypothetical protein